MVGSPVTEWESDHCHLPWVFACAINLGGELSEVGENKIRSWDMPLKEWHNFILKCGLFVVYVFIYDVK